MNTAPEIRLHLFFAAETNSAVILLRKAKRLYRLVLWNHSIDTFTDGQWLKKEMYPDACQLSPDGKHFLFTVISQHPNAAAFPSYTTISTPPFFTAHMLFPNTYGYGPSFLGNELVLLRDTQARDAFGTYKGMKQVIRGEVTKDCKTGLRLTNGQPAPLSPALRQDLLEGADKFPQSGHHDRYETSDGCLFRVEPGAGSNLIRDFRDMEFEHIKAPYDAPVWPSIGDRTGWHPLDADT